MKGLIVENISNLYKIEYDEKIYDASARGKLKKQEISPVVGDRVEFEIVDEKNKRAVIETILERKSYIKRPKLSNVDQIIFVVSSENPKPDLLLLDKQLAFAEFLRVKAVIVLNKTDLDIEKKFMDIRGTYEGIGYTVIETQAKKGTGIDNLIDILKGNINAFSGNSGVGKSTLINAIFRNELALEGEISERNKRGKNTTTAIKLYEIDEDTYIADTPGFSTFDISEINSEDLCKYFIEFNEYINDCEFIGCSHIKEKNCGIKNAIDLGKINKGRYDRFCKIYEELKKKEERKW